VLAKDVSQNKVHLGKLDHPNTQVIIRFMHPLNWLDNIYESATTQANRVIEKYPELQALNPLIIYGNELNLHYECNDPDPGNQWKYTTKEHFQKIYRWTELVAQKILAKYPNARLLPPPMAFGHNEDGEPDDNGNPKIGWAGYDYLVPLLPQYFNNTMTAHYYWGHANGSNEQVELYDDLDAAWYAFRWKRVLKMLETRHNKTDVKIIIDEAGNFEAAQPSFIDQAKFYLNNTLSDPRILGVLFFLWEDTTFSPGNMPNSWLQNIGNIEAFVNEIKTVEVDDGVGAEPDPQPPDQGGNMGLFRTFQESKDVLDESLRVHAVDSSGKIIGSVARIVPVDEAQKRWDSSNMPKQGDKYWKVIRATLINEEQSRGNVNIGVSFVDENGIPYSGANAWFAYPTSKLSSPSWIGAFDNGNGGNGDVFTYADGSGEIAQGKNNFSPPMGSEELGPYVVGGAGLYSEVISGFGLTGNRHISYAVTFQLSTYGDSGTVPPDPEPPTTPDEPDCGCNSYLGKWLISLVKKYFC